MQVSGLLTPVVSAPIQHASSERNSGFGPARARLARGMQTRSRRRTRAVRKLEDALGVAVFAGQTVHRHRHPPSVDEARAVWENCFGGWQTYNQLRSAACELSLLLAAVALRLLGPSGSHRHRLARPARDDSE